ncbi:MAG: Fe-S oxidoreductase [Gammaproteobacteria bacterium]|nr:Fe-S oxidoreductase [Gammaproteobacteria bacterium]
MADETAREGSLEAPRRHPLDWRNSSFYDETALQAELERVFEVCHGCRRCFSLCNAFPTLFDAIDATDTGELEGVPKQVFRDVVDHCYLCDMCFMSKCPYVPPHPWNIDFPHLMLRAKAQRFRAEGAPWRDRLLTDTDTVGRLAGIPVVAEVVNAVNATGAGRALLEHTLGVARDAPLPRYESRSARQRLGSGRARPQALTGPAGGTTGRVVLFTTCYGNRNLPAICEDLVAVFEHNGIEVRLADTERCCGMPKLELGDLDAVARSRDANVPALAHLVAEGWDIVAPVPSCVLMFKQELPLMFPGDDAVNRVAGAFFDPFAYLVARHRAGRLRTDFAAGLGKVAYQVPCHLRVQNIGLKTRELLELVPDTQVQPIERCSGHDGTYGVKQRFRAASLRIAAPVVSRVRDAGAAHFTSDCPMAGEQIAGALGGDHYTHPLTLLRQAYGL